MKLQLVIIFAIFVNISIGVDIANKINGFTFDLMREDFKSNSKNLIFSPVSIYEILSMLSLGADTNTKKELDTVLKWNPSENMDMMRDLYKNLLEMENKNDVAFANKIWIDSNDGSTILTSYIDQIKNIFHTNVVSSNIQGDSKAKRLEINKWVAKKTNGHIKDFFPEGSINPTTNLLFVNAIYFQSNWKVKFDKRDTHKGKFHLTNGKSINVEYMWKSDKVPYFYDSQHRMHVLELPYESDNLSMIIAMPKRTDHLVSFDKNDLENWIRKLNIVRPKHMEISIPKFKLDGRLNLKKHLKSLGIHDLFTAGKADLSGINGRRNLFCETALHKSFLDVNEEGTSAASASGAGLLAMSMPLTVKIDRTFAFFIVRKPMNIIMFAGRVVNPTLE